MKLCPEDFRSSAGGVVQKDKKGKITRHVLAALRKDIKIKVAKYNMCQVCARRSLPHAAPLPAKEAAPAGGTSSGSLDEGLMGPCLRAAGPCGASEADGLSPRGHRRRQAQVPPLAPIFLLTYLKPPALPQLHINTQQYLLRHLCLGRISPREILTWWLSPGATRSCASSTSLAGSRAFPPSCSSATLRQVRLNSTRSPCTGVDERPAATLPCYAPGGLSVSTSMAGHNKTSNTLWFVVFCLAAHQPAHAVALGDRHVPVCHARRSGSDGRRELLRGCAGQR